MRPTGRMGSSHLCLLRQADPGPALRPTRARTHTVQTTRPRGRTHGRPCAGNPRLLDVHAQSAHGFLLGAKRRSNPHHKLASSNDDCFNLNFESCLDPVGACLWGSNRSVEFKVLRYATMNAVILPSRQADQPVPALPFPCLQRIEWREKANEVNFLLCQKFAIFSCRTAASSTRPKEILPSCWRPLCAH